MDAYHLVSRWINDPWNIMNVIGTSNDCLTFPHTAAPRCTRDRATVTCFNCQKMAILIMTVQVAKAQAPQQPQK